MNVTDLKEFLRSMKLTTTGSKADLMNRVLETDPEGILVQQWFQDKMSKLMKESQLVAAQKEINSLTALLENARKEIVNMKQQLQPQITKERSDMIEYGNPRSCDCGSPKVSQINQVNYK